MEDLNPLFDAELGETATLSVETSIVENLDCWLLLTMSGELKEKGLLLRISNTGEKMWEAPLELNSTPTGLEVDSLSMESRISLSDGSILSFDATGASK